MEEVTVNTITDDHAYSSTSSRPTTSSASMISSSTTSNVMVNDSNLGRKQANVISSSSASLNMKLVRKSNSTSAIWTYFGFNADKRGNPIDDGRPKCRTCFKEVSCKSGNTTNLFKHLQDRHPRLHMELAENKVYLIIMYSY